MTTATAQKLLQIIDNLERMIATIGAKQKLLKSKIQECKSEADESIINEATLVLGGELDGINKTISLVEELHEHLACATI